MLAGKGKIAAVKESCVDYLYTGFYRLMQLDKLTRNDINSTGFVIDSLEAALWCFIHTDSYKECVLTAVNLGDDTDTIAAIAGGLAGIFYGVSGDKGIPEEWIEQIARHEWIKGLCDAFESKFKS
jgi:ADP-ribosylglycohydrolase